MEIHRTAASLGNQFEAEMAYPSANSQVNRYLTINITFHHYYVFFVITKFT